MSSQRKVLIIGGGIAGPAMALALQKAGIDSVVYEAHPGAAAQGGGGAFLTVATNGLNALRILGAEQPVLAAGFPSPSITLRSHTGKLLGSTSTGSWRSDDTPSHTIKRADLHGALRDEAARRGIRIEHGKRAVAAEETAAGVRVSFADATTAEGELLIGCDGIRSIVRMAIDSNAPAPTYLGLVNAGGYANGVEIRDSKPGVYEMIFGKRAFFGYVAVPNSHNKETWWFANVPRADEPARGELESVEPEARRAWLLDLFADDAGPALALIKATPQVLGAGPSHAVPHLPRWHRGRMVVVGDAAHAPPSSSGQGASLALEDAVMLALCLRDLPDHEAAFTHFEMTRRPRIETIIKWAERTSSSKAAGPVGRTIRDALMPFFMKMAAALDSSQKLIYDYKLDWDKRIVGNDKSVE